MYVLVTLDSTLHKCRRILHFNERSSKGQNVIRTRLRSLRTGGAGDISKPPRSGSSCTAAPPTLHRIASMVYELFYHDGFTGRLEPVLTLLADAGEDYTLSREH